MIGRVIARPFLGQNRATFRRTANRRDFAMPPPPGTLFDSAAAAGRMVVSVGKTADIFAHKNTGLVRKGDGNEANLALTVDALGTLPDGGLVFTNLVEFDSEFGHRRDIAGYADCLERFDRRLPDLLSTLRPDDLLVITADHGNDPTAPGTNHTREVVPILGYCASLGTMRIARRATFADVAATVGGHLGLAATPTGTSWLGRAGITSRSQSLSGL